MTEIERDALRRLCDAGDEHPDIAVGLVVHGSIMAMEHRKHVHLEAWMALPKILDALDEAEKERDVALKWQQFYMDKRDEAERHGTAKADEATKLRATLDTVRTDRDANHGIIKALRKKLDEAERKLAEAENSTAIHPSQYTQLKRVFELVGRHWSAGDFGEDETEAYELVFMNQQT